MGQVDTGREGAFMRAYLRELRACKAETSQIARLMKREPMTGPSRLSEQLDILILSLLLAAISLGIPALIAWLIS